MTHQFFQGFIPQQEQVTQNNTTKELAHNLMVLELSNNWEAVKNLVQRMVAAGGETIGVDVIEHDWAQFINSNKIDITSFKNEDEFTDQILKPLVKEENKS